MPTDNKVSSNFAHHRSHPNKGKRKEHKNDGNKSTINDQNSKNMPQRRTVEMVVLTEEPVELYEHRITEWQNDIVSDVRKLLARPANHQMHQKIVTTEILTIPKQSVQIPIEVEERIEIQSLKEIISVNIKIEQTDVPVIETVEMVSIPRKVTKRTTKITDHSVRIPVSPFNDQNYAKQSNNKNASKECSEEVSVEIESKHIGNVIKKEQNLSEKNAN
jgi:hypothetical protein